MPEDPSRPRHSSRPQPPPRQGGGPPRSGGKKPPPQRRDFQHPEDPVVEKILLAANQALEAIGPALPEPFYRELLGHFLSKSGLSVQIKPRGVLKHREKIAHEFSPDFLIEKSVVTDIRMVPEEFTKEQLSHTGGAQKFFNARHGLLLDFTRNEARHHKLRLGNDPFPTIPHEEMLRGSTVEKHDQMRATMLCRSIQRIGRAHGLGFGEQTYRGLLRVEFDAEALDYQDEPSVVVQSGGLNLGETKLQNFMIVQRSGALLVLAQPEGIRGAERERMRAALKFLKLPWGLIINFGRRRFEWQWESRA